MDLRHIVPVVIIIAGGLFFAFREDPVGERKASNLEETKSEKEISRSASGSDDDNAHGGRVVSKRVLTDRPKVVTTDSGLQYEVLTEGEGDHPGPTSQVKVHYSGTLEDGTVFDSSWERGQPAVFGLNQVIKGWTEGVQLMRPGAVYRFVIPSDLAYGDRGAGSAIPGGATLTFKIELISIEKA